MPNTPFAKRAIHLDCHTMPGAADIGRDFNAQEFADTLAKAHIDYITVFAKCNLGFSYYPTKIGITYPGLNVDLLGGMVEACHARGIRVAAYFNTGIDHEHARRHREWCKVDAQGRVCDMENKGHFCRDLCLNTGYADHVAGMVGEVLDRYPVDGIFLDCFDLRPCYGIECLEGMKAEGVDVFSADQATAYCARMTDTFLDRIEALAHQKRDGIFVYFNGIRSRRQPTHIEIEVLPTGGWGYEYLPFAIRYVRTLEKPYFTMTARFHKSWGDFGGLRTKHSLLYDLYYSIANGGTCSVGDHLHPRAKLDPAVYKLIGEAYDSVSALDPWVEGAKAEAECVVVEPQLRYWPTVQTSIAGGRAFTMNSVEGAARILSELQYQFDISDGQGDLSNYKVAILPDSVPVDDALRGQLDALLKRGGGIISSGSSCVAADGKRFALDAYAMEFERRAGEVPWYIEALPPVTEGLPEMLFTMYQPCVAVRPGAMAQVLAMFHQPYSPLHKWDYEHETMYCPPEKEAGFPAVIRSGNVIHFCFPLFQGYLQDAVIPHRTLLRNCLRLLLPQPMIEVVNLPSFGRATVTQREGRRLVHLLTYLPELRGTMQIIEEPIEARDVEVRLRHEATVLRVFLAPGEEAVPFVQEAGVVRFTVPRVNGYALAVVE